MNIFRTIQRWATARNIAHVTMLCFAVASLANVESFFHSLHGNNAVSWGLGIALGAALVVMAGLLADMRADWNDRRFQIVLSVTVALALLSGGIQAAAYAAHMPGNEWAAVIIGLALPVVGELGIALAVAAYRQAQQTERMSNAQEALADGVRAMIGDAVATIDPSRVRAQVDRAAATVAREIVDSTVRDMIAELRSNARRTDNLQDTDDLESGQMHHMTKNSGQKSSPMSGDLGMANDAKLQNVNTRRAAMLQLFQMYGAMSIGELQSRLQDDRGITAGDKTLRRDCAELITLGDLVKPSRGRWDVARPIIAELPQPATTYSNGITHG